MNPRTVLLAAIVFAVVAGCRRDPYLTKYVESLHGDIRLLEDYVYQLEHENSVLVEELEVSKSKTDRPGRERPTPVRERARPDLPDDPSLSPPVIDPGTPSPPDIELPPASDATPARSQGTLTSAKPTRETETVRDFHVTHLFLNPYLTRGRDTDQQPGDDGLLVVVEPRNAADQYLSQPGPISIVLLDPRLDGDAARFARWDFSADEVRKAMRPGNQQRGIHLWLPWPDRPPLNSRMHLYLRYVAADGRRIQVDQPIFVTLPGQFSQRWTPRPSSRGSASVLATQPPSPGSENVTR